MKSEKLTTALAFLLLLVTLTAAAEDVMPPGGCRRGTPKSVTRTISESLSPSEEGRTPGGDFYHGDRRQLVVLAAFADQAFLGDESATLTQWDRIFNVENLSEGSFFGSVRDYFLDQSYQQLSLQFDLHFVTVSGDRMKYRSTAADDENSQYLVEDVMDVLKDRAIDWSLYDWNGDGYVNQLLIIYAGKGMGQGGDSNSIWPHQWWMSEHLKDGQRGVYCEPIAVSHDGRQYLVDCYCALAECDSRGSYGTFGTICHEYSHCFGLPDFYGNTSYVHGWDLMDSGNYNDGGYRPAGYSAHERWLMGWLTPAELTEAASITDLQPLSSDASALSADASPRCYLVRNDGYGQEYYMVENRQQTGWDAGLPGSGLLVFHIDFEPSLWTSVTESPNNSSRQHYVLFHANNSSSYTYWPYPYRTNNQLTNESSPAATLWHANSDGTLLMSKPLTNISVTTGGVASFDFLGGATSLGEQPHSTPLPADRTVCDLQGRKFKNHEPLSKGLYIVNGRKVVVR